MAIILSALITGLFSAYLLFAYVQLKMKAAVSNMRSVLDTLPITLYSEYCRPNWV